MKVMIQQLRDAGNRKKKAKGRMQEEETLSNLLAMADNRSMKSRNNDATPLWVCQNKYRTTTPR